MMLWLKALQTGFFGGRGKAWTTVLFYAEGLLLSALVLAPLSKGFHAALDRYPAASDFRMGGGLDLLGELALNQPGLWAAAFGALGLILLLHVPLSLFLTTGAYGLAVRDRERPLREFWGLSGRSFLPFVALFFLNLLLWAIPLAVAGVILFGVGKALGEGGDAGKAYAFFWLELVIIAVLANLLRNSIGYTQARYALAGAPEGLGRCLLKGAAFSLKRFIPVNLITWICNALRALALALGIFVLSPGYATEGKAWVTALLLQAALFAAAFVRVAEIRAQVAYLAPAMEAEGQARPNALAREVERSGETEPAGPVEGDLQGDPAASESSPTIL
jgi:hypothetical protein